MNSISVIIVSWNAEAHLRRCLASLQRFASDCVIETIIVDNDSSDGSAAMVSREFPGMTLVRCDSNLGFAKANNIGIARAKGDCVALINSDVVVHEGCLQDLLACLAAHPEAALAAPRISGRFGELQLTCRRFPSVWNTVCRFFALDRLLPNWPVFSGFELPAAFHQTMRAAPAIGGCFWLLRRSAIDQVGTFDERFFFYAEDIDWCKRFGQAGWSLLYCPGASASHYGGGSSEGAPIKYSIEIIRSTLKYWHKHHGPIGHLVCRLMYILHHMIRLIPRTLLFIVNPTGSPERTRKIAEDYFCLRWLLTGYERFRESPVVSMGER